MRWSRRRDIGIGIEGGVSEVVLAQILPYVFLAVEFGGGSILVCAERPWIDDQ